MVDRYVGVRYREPPLPPHWGTLPPYPTNLPIPSVYQQTDQHRPTKQTRQGEHKYFQSAYHTIRRKLFSYPLIFFHGHIMAQLPDLQYIK